MLVWWLTFLVSSEQCPPIQQVMQAAFGGTVASLEGQQLLLSLASPLDGCSVIQNSGAVAGTAVLMSRGTCYLSTKVANAQAAGAAIAIVYDDEVNDYFLMLADDGTAASITIPAASLPRSIGQLLTSATQAYIFPGSSGINAVTQLLPSAHAGRRQPRGDLCGPADCHGRLG